mgnify:CR=1 FL=1
MKVTIVSIPVTDQEKALKFYTDKLGFIKKKDVRRRIDFGTLGWI